jgi:hypothetical protein
MQVKKIQGWAEIIKQHDLISRNFENLNMFPIFFYLQLLFLWLLIGKNIVEIIKLFQKMGCSNPISNISRFQQYGMNILSLHPICECSAVA